MAVKKPKNQPKNPKQPETRNILDLKSTKASKVKGT